VRPGLYHCGISSALQEVYTLIFAE
jgi:hypothetical protein